MLESVLIQHEQTILSSFVLGWANIGGWPGSGRVSFLITKRGSTGTVNLL